MKSLLLCGVALLAGMPAFAQNPPALNAAADPNNAAPLPNVTARGSARHSGLEEVVVTARRTRENLQNVPVAVTALSSKDLRDRQIQSVADIQGNVPDVSVQPQFGDPSTPFIEIRGFSNGTLNPSVDSAIGLYVDDVYLGRAVGSAFDLADISSLEVLRGPQGTLFGRNATGGAISIHTAQPTGKLDGRIETTFGDYNEKRVRAYVDTPEFDGISMRISVLHDSNDGYVTRSGPAQTYQLPPPFGAITSANSYGANDRTGVSAAIHYQASPDLTFDYKFDYTHQVQSQLAVQGLGYETGDSFAQLLGASQPAGAVPISMNRLSSLPLDFMTPGTLDTLGHSLTALYNIDDQLSVKSISAYRTQRQETGGNDIDGGTYVGNGLSAAALGVPAGDPYCIICGIANRSQNQFSQEVQFLGKTDLYQFVAGGYFFHESASQNDAIFSAYFGNGILTPTGFGKTINPVGYTLGALDHADNDSAAGYAHATIHLTPKFDISGGLRYTADMRTYDHEDPTDVFVKKVNYSNVDWDASVTYKFTPTLNVYGKIATAYLAGGALGSFTFQPEHNTSFEAGFRSELLHDTLRLNVTGFYQNITDLQVTEFDVAHGTYIINAGSESIPGIEMDLSYRPIAGLRFDATYGHQRTPNSINPITNGVIPSLYPSDNIGLMAEYSTQPVYKDAYLTFHADTSWHSAFPLVTPIPTNPVDARLYDAAYSPSEWNTNLRVSLNDIPLGPVKGRLSLWVRNVANDNGLNFAREVFFTVGTFDVPRTYGIDLAVDF